MATVRSVVDCMEKWWPPKLAAAWDNVGLLLGDKAETIHSVITCLTVTRSVVDEAVESGAGMIVSHHPVLFSPVKKLTADSVQGRNLLRLLEKKIAVYSPHTAHDSASGGVNDQIAVKIGLEKVKPLKPREEAGKFKLVVFVPENALEKLSTGLFAAGAGIIGNYTECSFWHPGNGTFLPGVGANPAIGQVGKREVVPELRVEFLAEQRNLARIVEALRANHPYEEPAFDLFPLLPEPSLLGEGRIGSLPSGQTAFEIVEKCHRLFGGKQIQLLGAKEKKVNRVAIGCGAAGSWAQDAIAAGADLFLTGEMRYHEELESFQSGLSVILLGHHTSERFAMVRMAQRLQEAIPDLIAWPARQDDLERHVLRGD